MSNTKWIAIANDGSGNPRYVCHYSHLVAKHELRFSIGGQYQLALERAKPLGGKIFDNKQFGGGIAFVAYDIDSLDRQIVQLMEAENGR